MLAELLTGIILIICGLLVKINPNLIAGYNSLSEKEKKKINVNKLSTMMRNYLVIIGSIAVITGIVLYILDVKESYRLMSLIAIVVVGVLIMVMNGQNYQKD